MIKVLEDKFGSENFNKISIHPLQSWQWGEARKQMGVEVLRIGEYSSNQIINIYQITFHKIPFSNFKIGYLPRSKFPSKAVLEFLYDYSKKNNLIFIKIEPYVFKSEIRNSQLRITDYELIKSPHPLFPSWTQILDLTKSEDELLKKMHHKTRYNIRLAQKKGVTLKEMSNADGFEIFARLYFETCKRQKYFGHNLLYHKIIWENLKQEIAHILIAYFKDVPLAAFELFYYKDTMYYPYGGTSAELRNLMASNLLMWNSILLGKKLGAKKFDMWGSLPPNHKSDHPWSGFTRFKRGYGGEFVEFVGSLDLIINPLAYKIYNLTNNFRNAYLKLKRLI